MAEVWWRQSNVPQGESLHLPLSGETRLRYPEAVTQTPPQDLAPIVSELALELEFPQEVWSEVERLTSQPGIDDARLDDLSHLPFVTIDGKSSKDLDQALFIEQSATGHVVHYALADAAHFVPTGSALFSEALARGASFYFPGYSVPMLPRELSEGLVSLNPQVDRRALVFEMTLDEAGRLAAPTRVRRGRIRSRAKLAWEDVQGFYDEPEQSPLRREPFADSLRALMRVGELRIAQAELANVVRYRRRELDVTPGSGGSGFVVIAAVRDRVELYNEQISLLVNREGGRLLSESRDPRLQPIYRVHPAPDPEKLAALVALSRGMAKVHDLPRERFALSPGESLNALLDRLPTEGPALPVARALERQAILVNMRSGFSTQPAEHFGVGAEVYARFSAPMREVVGIFLHKEMLEHMSLAAPGDRRVDEELRDRVVTSANRAREVQRRANDLVNRRVLDAVFAARVGQKLRGTVMGLTASKVHVELSDPPLDVKVYLRDLGQLLAGMKQPSKTRGKKPSVWLDVVDDGAALVVRGEGQRVCRVGDVVEIEPKWRDEGQDRWVLDLAAMAT